MYYTKQFFKVFGVVFAFSLLLFSPSCNHKRVIKEFEIGRGIGINAGRVSISTGGIGRVTRILGPVHLSTQDNPIEVRCELFFARTVGISRAEVEVFLLEGNRVLWSGKKEVVSQNRLRKKKKVMGYSKVYSKIVRFNVEREGDYYLKVWIKRGKGTLYRARIKLVS